MLGSQTRHFTFMRLARRVDIRNLLRVLNGKSVLILSGNKQHFTVVSRWITAHTSSGILSWIFHLILMKTSHTPVPFVRLQTAAAAAWTFTWLTAASAFTWLTAASAFTWLTAAAEKLCSAKSCYQCMWCLSVYLQCSIGKYLLTLSWRPGKTIPYFLRFRIVQWLFTSERSELGHWSETLVVPIRGSRQSVTYILAKLEDKI